MTANPEIELLLVEDSSSDAMLIQANLRIGLGEVGISTVERLGSAIEALQSRSFSAILLDLNLPDSSGVDTFRRLLSNCNGTPIVVLSGMEDEQTAMDAVGAGADDYVQKLHFDAQTLARSVRFAIERGIRRAAERELVAIRSEMSSAQQIQDSLYPETAPEMAGLDIASGVRSAGIGCGDYYDFIPLRDGRFIIVVGDVSGHGMASAMVMAETRACLRTLTDVNVQPGAILPAMNRLIYAGTSPSMFVTLLLIVFDPATGEFQYFNAGHPGWVVRDNRRQALVTHQLPLGLLMDLDYSTSDTFRLNPGDILVVPTDGIAETFRGSEMFGNDRLLDCVETNREQPAETIVAELFSQAIAFGESDELTDDMTIVIMKADGAGTL